MKTAVGRYAALAAMTLGLAWQTAALAQSRLDQAQQNYQALLDGRKQIGQLSPQELADVIELDRRLRAQKPDTRSLSQRCVDDEMKRAGHAVSQLERRVIDMKCREAGD